MKQPLFVHSKCCCSHWAIIKIGNELALQCKECGKSAGDFTVKADNYDSGYILSKCCKAYWELVHFPDGKFKMQCEKCDTVSQDIDITSRFKCDGCDLCDHDE